MRRIAGSFAALLLSLFMVSTSISASACDLSCWLHRAHSNCHAEGSGTPGNDMAMSMPSDMDMGTDHNEGMTVPAPKTAVTARSMLMSAQVQMAKKRFDYETNPEPSSTGLPDHSKNISSCAHELCSQIWASVSPLRGENPLLSSPHSIANSISNVPNVRIGSDSIRLETHPPSLPAVDLAATLRI